MKKLFIIFIFIMPAFAFARVAVKGKSVAPTSSPSKFKIALNYDFDRVGAADLNGARRVFNWNNTTPTSGTFDNLKGYGITFGYGMWDGYLSLQYNTLTQELPNTDISGATYSIQDTFVYDSIYLIYDTTVYTGDWLIWDLGLGLGKTLKYEFHQKNSGGNGEDVTWVGDAIAWKLRTNFGYRLNSTCRIGLEVQYESVSSEMEAAKGYATTIGGSPIANGQKLKNANSNSNVNVDMGGIHYGLNLSFYF